MKYSLQLILPLLTACLAVLAFMASAQQVYKVTQDDGTVVYTDKPAQQSEALELRANTGNTSDALATPSPQKKQGKKAPSTDYQLAIVYPEPEATIRDNNGVVTIRSSLSPQNASGRFELWFDGKVTAVNTTGTFALTGVNRGAHNYQVRLIDNTGKTLASTPSQTLYLHQASVLINPQ